VRRIFQVCTLMICAAMSLPAEGAQERREVFTVKAATLKGPSGFGTIKLFEDPPYLGEGVSLELEVLPTPQEMVARVSGGELDFAVFPANMGAKLYTEGPGYRLGAVVGLGALSVLSRDKSIDSWHDLEGRSVRAVGKGATPDYLLRYLLAENGLDAGEDVEIDFSVKSAPQLAQLLIGGKAETAVLPEPFITMVRLKSKGAVTAVLDFQSEWMRVQGSETAYPFTVVVVKPSLAEEHPELVAAFLDAYRGSIAWVNEEPAEAARLIGKYEILPAAMAEPAIVHCNLVYIPAAEARGLMEEYLSVLLSFNPASVGGKLPDEDFYFEP
jgi:NitT/TauT family transport system substrate-binding protein